MKRTYKTVRKEGEVFIKIENFKLVEKWTEHLNSFIKCFDRDGDVYTGITEEKYGYSYVRFDLRKNINIVDLKNFNLNKLYIENLTYYKAGSPIISVPVYFQISNVGKHYVIGSKFIIGNEEDIEKYYEVGKIFCDLKDTVKCTEERSKKKNWVCEILKRYCDNFGYDVGKFLLEFVDLE